MRISTSVVAILLSASVFSTVKTTVVLKVLYFPDADESWATVELAVVCKRIIAFKLAVGPLISLLE